MRIISIALSVLIFGLAACTKDKFATKPSLKIKDVSTNEVIPANPLDQTPPFVITLEFTDAEGDLAGGRVGVQKIVPNCQSSQFLDTLSYKISDNLPANKNQKAELDVIFPYFKINPICNFNDTATFKVWITDKAGHTSDTATTGTIVIRKS